jgi:drug/metabolite transporter (DMT)-like permease
MGNWLLFWTLGLIWGSSFLLIKIGVQELSPFSLVSGRLGVTAIAFIFLFLALRKGVPRDRKMLMHLTIAAVISTAAPFLIIAWAENSIDSGLASVLQATVPLFSILIAHVALQDDKIHRGKFIGLVTGMIGVVLLALRSSDPKHVNAIEGQIAMLVASMFYAVGAVYVRRMLRSVEPVVSAGVTMTVAAIVVIVLTLFIVRPLPNVSALQPGTILAVVGLGLVNTFIAYIIYYRLIANWGASRATMVTYVVPLMGLLLGTFLGHEPMDLNLLAGTVLIIGGVALANWRKSPPKAAEPLPEAAAGQATT